MPNESTPSEPEPEMFGLNPTGDYLKCIESVNKSESFKEYFNVSKSGMGISPGLTSGMLKENLTSKELNKGVTRLAIAIGFCYEFGLMFAGMNK